MSLSREILFLLRAKDDASKDVRKVKQAFDDASGSAGKAGKTLGLLGGILTREVGQSLQSFGSTVLSTFTTFADEARESIHQTKALNAVLASTKGAAGLTADEVLRMADSLSKVTNYEDDVVLRGQNMLLTFTHIGRDVFPQATEAMLNISTAMGTDVKSAAIQLGKALNDPLAGLDALTRVGVSFNAEQKTMIERMVESGNVAGAQQVILQELEKEFGGLARATSDARTRMGNAFTEIQEEIGKTLIPAFESTAQALLPVLQNVGAWIQENPELVKTIGLVTVVVGGLVSALGTLVVVLGSVAAALAVLGVSLAAGGALFVAIAGVSALVVTFTQHWEGLKWMAGEAIDYMMGKLDGLLAKLESIKQQFLDFIALIKIKIQGVQDSAGPALQGNQPTFEQNQTPRRAGGGWADEPFTWVGEHGPEVVSLPRGSYVHTARDSQKMLGGTQLVIQAPLVGEVHVHNEADENRLLGKLDAWLARQVQKQTLGAA